MVLSLNYPPSIVYKVGSSVSVMSYVNVASALLTPISEFAVIVATFCEI